VAHTRVTQHGRVCARTRQKDKSETVANNKARWVLVGLRHIKFTTAILISIHLTIYWTCSVVIACRLRDDALLCGWGWDDSARLLCMTMLLPTNYPISPLGTPAASNPLMHAVVPFGPARAIASSCDSGVLRQADCSISRYLSR
jgi:hypothetical protein